MLSHSPFKRNIIWTIYKPEKIAKENLNLFPPNRLFSVGQKGGRYIMYGDTNCTGTHCPGWVWGRVEGSQAQQTGTTRLPRLLYFLVGTARKITEIMTTAKFDDILMGILQHCEQVEPFLDAIFSFLARRTDFFQVMHDRSDKMGFPPGVAEKIVLKVDLKIKLNTIACTWLIKL